jgi:hypothetical protein
MSSDIKKTKPELFQHIVNVMEREKVITKEDIFMVVKKVLEQEGYGVHKDIDTGNITISHNFDKTYFTHDINGNKWEGFVYKEHNALMGSIFSLFNGKPFIVRGYPKIKYTEDARLFGNYIDAEEKIDGSCLGIYTLPDKTPKVKTRGTEIAGDYNGVKFGDLLKETGLYDALVRVATDYNLCIFGEIYGQKNQGEFVKYDFPVKFKVFDIVDMNTFRFLPREKVVNICSMAGLPYVKVEWTGVITEDEYEKLRKILDGRMDIEGFVAKMDTESDRIFGKIKSDRTKEKCIKLCGPSIPKEIINKAIKKAQDDGVKLIDALEFVRKELLEESEEDLINKSEARIKNMIAYAYKVDDRDALINKEMIKQAYDMIKGEKSKGEIMSYLANHYPLSPTTLFRAYIIANNLFQNGTPL